MMLFGNGPYSGRAVTCKTETDADSVIGMGSTVYVNTYTYTKMMTYCLPVILSIVGRSMGEDYLGTFVNYLSVSREQLLQIVVGHIVCWLPGEQCLMSRCGARGNKSFHRILLGYSL